MSMPGISGMVPVPSGTFQSSTWVINNAGAILPNTVILTSWITGGDVGSMEAATVIDGTSLFGGRGKALHAVLGGLVIAAIDNGMGLQGYSAPAKYVVTALVLVAAVTIDAVAHRGRART